MNMFKSNDLLSRDCILQIAISTSLRVLFLLLQMSLLTFLWQDYCQLFLELVGVTRIALIQRCIFQILQTVSTSAQIDSLAIRLHDEYELGHPRVRFDES